MLQTIKNLLNENNITYREVHHEPTPTSEDSARARGEDLATGGKALVLKVGDMFGMFIISAAKKLDSKAVKQHFGSKKCRFADKDELLELTRLVPGAVPPFGKPFFDLPLFVDTSITQNEKIAFNAGSLTDSIVMSVEDYMKVAEPEVFLFSKE